MRLLLDENIPKRLKLDLSDHEVYTVREKGWNGLRNGDLLKLMLGDGIEALLTFDKNLTHQQNFRKYPISVFVFIAKNNTYELLQPLMAQVKDLINARQLMPGLITVK